MCGKNLRVMVVDEARQNASAHLHFRHPSVLGGYDWVVGAWADVRKKFGLTARQAIELWPVYWEAICEETAKLVSNRRSE
jgi:hypothetical protein